MDRDWNTRLHEQLDWLWNAQLRPRLDGLTDEEYFWEPVAGCWSVRRRGDLPADQPAGTVVRGPGDYTIDLARPEPDPPPVTTIAWRLAHIIVVVFGARVASHFGGPPASYDTWHYAGTAAEALRQLDEGYARWSEGVRKLGEDELFEPCGPAESPWHESPMADLVLHINREAIHHGAEIALLRDLYRHR